MKWEEAEGGKYRVGPVQWRHLEISVATYALMRYYRTLHGIVSWPMFSPPGSGTPSSTPWFNAHLPDRRRGRFAAEQDAGFIRSIFRKVHRKTKYKHA